MVNLRRAMFWFILLIHILSYTIADNIRCPLISIPQGLLKGQYITTVNNRTISSFTAIPYVQAPVGNLRFELPMPSKPWIGVLDATKPIPSCPQINADFATHEVLGIIGDEDCLYLNVYTPKLQFFYYPEVPNLLPVMLWIHGGGFAAGSADADIANPDFLLDKDVILVAINYRLGPLGFISTGDDIVPGNNGLKDQTMAIKWVKANIDYFGGDPENIILFGLSAGSSSSHYHMLSPLSTDLINGAISHSGTAFSAWALDPSNRTIRNTLRLASSLNCPTDTSINIINCLKKADAREITERHLSFNEWFEILGYGSQASFLPVVEKNISGAFLPDHPREIIKSGKVAKVPFLLGISTDEGAALSPNLMFSPAKLEYFNSNFDKLAPITFYYSESAPNPNYVTAKIKEFYFGDQPITTNSYFSRKARTDVYGDSYFLSGANEAAWLHTNYIQNPVYYYVFGYHGIISYSQVYGGGSSDFGVCHGDDTLYLFNPYSLFAKYQPTDTDESMREVMTTLWTNFAYSGNPTPQLDSVIKTKWEPVQSEDLEYYFIKNATDIKMDEKLFWNRTLFWKSLPIW